MNPSPQRSPGSNRGESASKSTNVAYLMVVGGGRYGDVFRLEPERVMTIGRAPGNQVVLADDMCSRNHCEIFHMRNTWRLRDLESRNGTTIDGVGISGEYELEEGQTVEIGSFAMVFTHNLDETARRVPSEERESDTSSTSVVKLEEAERGTAPLILHRKRRTRYRTTDSDRFESDRYSRELTSLYRLALEMGAARDTDRLSSVVLEGLFSGTKAHIGAVLLLPESLQYGATPQPRELEMVAFQSRTERKVRQVSAYLSNLVLSEWEAVLARDIADDSALANRDSIGQLLARSVICAPIREGRVMHGVIHLYGTEPEQPLDPDDLEYTLAVADQMAVALENLKERETLSNGLARIQDENRTLRQQLAIDSEIVGASPQVEDLRNSIARIAPSDATALIRGESGVGKELVARAIHFNSDRCDGPFVCMNCAALSESLLESELFGHEKGSFTGATERKIGKFEQAHTGTLFLDEVGEMGPAIQAKFLRVLEGHIFERVGGRTPIEVDVRVVAATNRDLERAVQEGQFRKDLYYRLYVVEISVPPLRERRTDIPLLAQFFLERFAQKSGRQVAQFDESALRALMAHDWPGNVRELQNTVERSVILSADRTITESGIRLSTLGDVAKQSGETPAAGVERLGKTSLEQVEKQHILATLQATQWNKSQAAQILGIERSTLDRKLKRYKVGRPQ